MRLSSAFTDYAPFLSEIARLVEVDPKEWQGVVRSRIGLVAPLRPKGVLVDWQAY